MSTNDASSELRETVTIVNRLGLHARASAKLARVAGDFQSKVMVCKDNVCVVATSIMGLMMLGAAKGDEITITATGSDQETAIAEAVKLISGRFGEQN